MTQPDQSAEKLAETRKKLENAGTLHWFHWLIVLSSLLLTLGAWQFAKIQLEAKVSLQFDHEAERVVDLIVERMQIYENILWSGVSLIQTTGGDIPYPLWNTFATNLGIEKKYSGINGIGVIHRVKPGQLKTYLKAQRAIRPDYTIHPTHNQPEYWPISYIIPVKLNQKAIGLDMAHEKNRYTAGKKARDTGLAQVTGPITLIQDAEQTPGFLFYAPFYQGAQHESVEARQTNFVGMVYAPFIVNKLMEGTLAKHNRRVSLRITDQHEMLYDEQDQHDPDFDSHPLFQKQVSIPLYGRVWTFDISSTQTFRAAASNNQPLTILLSGLLIDGLLIGLFILLTRGSRKALNYADMASRNQQLILNSVQEGIWGVDLKGKTTFVNPAAARMLGYAPEELLGTLMHQQVLHTKPDGSPYPREDGPMYAAYIQGATQTIAHEVLWRKDGTSFPVEYTSTPTRDEHDQVNGAVVTFRNITERLEHQRKIQTLSERLQLATQAGQIGVWDWDVLNQVLTWDTQMYQLYGKVPDTEANTYATWTAALHPEDQDRVQHALHEALADGAPFNTHFRIRWPNQSIHHIRALALVVQNDQGHAVRMTGVNWDITTEKVAENALTHKIDELHRSNAELEQFAYVASHDLQEPLRKIRNYADLLEVRTKNQLPPKTLKYLVPIVEGATRMQTLVQDLLSYSRVARGELTVEAIELQDIVREVQATLEPLITETHATLTIGPLPTLQVNPTQLEQLFQNLISNSLKYRGTHPPVIEVAATAKGKYWEIAVRDNGIGIEPQYAERIFVIFQRLHTKKEYSGTGIGLAICRKIVELHGGEIWVESTLGQGSTFFFTLPSNEYQSQAPELEPSSS